MINIRENHCGPYGTKISRTETAKFVRAAQQQGIAVILKMVFNY
jgi:pullulanase/glycogen debranching enzyme